MDKEQFEKDLKERQKKHLANVQRGKDPYWKPCMHDNCSECIGTGIKLDGSSCIHNIYCNCPKCIPVGSVATFSSADPGFTPGLSVSNSDSILLNGTNYGILLNTSNQEG